MSARNAALYAGLAGAFALAIFFFEQTGNGRALSAISLFLIWTVAAVSLNLINGTLGMLSLGHHGFMMVGAYVTALLTLPQKQKDLAYDLSPFIRSLHLDWLGSAIQVQMPVAILLGGLAAMLFALLVGVPVLRLRGDYIAIATLAFGEGARFLATGLPQVTNAGLGLKGVPLWAGQHWPTFVTALICIWVIARLTTSSFGRALKAIREDEIAAEAMGIGLARHKVMAFAVSGFFAGVAGGLYASWLGTVDPVTFTIMLTFFFLVATSVGGLGSITGAVAGTAFVVVIRVYFDFLERPFTLGALSQGGGVLLLAAAAVTLLVLLRTRRARLAPALPIALGAVGLAALALPVLASSWTALNESIQLFGLRLIALGLLLVLIMLFRREGIFGREELSWDGITGGRRRRIAAAQAVTSDARPGGDSAAEGGSR